MSKSGVELSSKRHTGQAMLFECHGDALGLKDSLQSFLGSMQIVWPKRSNFDFLRKKLNSSTASGNTALTV